MEQPAMSSEVMYGADEAARDGDAPGLRAVCELVVDEVQLDERRAAQAVDEGEHAVAAR
jgi:hypothetical protein